MKKGRIVKKSIFLTFFLHIKNIPYIFATLKLTESALYKETHKTEKSLKNAAGSKRSLI